MKYLEGFRDPKAAAALRARIDTLGATLAESDRSVSVMEVCGSHTMAIARFGIRGMLPSNVRLLSGPGCPVCVTGAGYVDAALALAERGVAIATFGDMLRVPGSETSLAEARADGARVEICYSPAAVIELARREPETEFVFLAIGFETTIAPVVSLVRAATDAGLDNVSLLTAFKLVPPALEALIADPEIGVDGFLCPAHVSVVIGSEAYRPVVDDHGLPCVVAGFEPLDILYGLVGLLESLVDGTPRLDNHYDRVVRPDGNPKARRLIETYLEPADALWRGLGEIPRSGLALRSEHRRFDAAERFGIEVGPGRSDPRCRCGEVLQGKIVPQECALFGTVCTPDTPVGACMVSSEGTCAAAQRYAGLEASA